jgi:serine phosphatase RsbU (regulator of sigma subunit)
MITRFLVADVAGHGARVSDVARWLQKLVAGNINRKSQVRLVAALNERFAKVPGMGTFATAVVGTYLTKGSRLTLCNAGHPRPFHYRATTRQWSIVRSTGGGSEESPANLPLGTDRHSSYRQMQAILDDGDLIFVYTDAVTESTDPNGKPLGERGLLTLLRGICAAPPASMAAAIIDRLGEFRGKTQPHDDLTFLLLRRNGQRRYRRSWSQLLDVYAKLFRLKPLVEPAREEDTSHA